MTDAAPLDLTRDLGQLAQLASTSDAVEDLFRRGLDLKAEVAGALAADYHSALVEEVKANDYRFDKTGRRA